jgi:CelD/BcsL family acetyltransferase involved in cellulose biosynthesis
VRKFTEAGESDEIHWVEYHRPEDIASFFELATPLARSTYQAKLFDGALPDAPHFIEHSRSLAARGKLRCYLLFLNESPVAYLYSPIEDRTAIYAYLGYDDAAAALSPGTVLQYVVHQQLFKDPEVDWFDFTEGEGAHKALFATEGLLCCNILYVRNTAKIRWSVKSHALWNDTINKLKKIINNK